MVNQEVIALGIVAITFLVILRNFFRSYLARPISQWLLSQGRVKAAMKVRGAANSQAGCTGCKS